jgi:Tannase and feruloyl esterase
VDFSVQRLTSLGVYPPQCEFEAIRAAAIAACDDLDGVNDGIIAAPNLCNFDSHTAIGQPFKCNETGANLTISPEAATIAQATWTGPRTVDGRFEWYGLNKDASFSGLANTTCDPNGICSGQPFGASSSWIQFFVLKDPTLNLTKISYRQFDSIFRQSNNQYASVIGASDPDLTDFREAGGKIITWHGLADELLSVKGTFNYYDRVLELDPTAADYFRVFPAPGVGHCAGGVGYFPANSLDSLVDWVENGIVPETLNGTTLPGASGKVRHAPLCPYPLVAAYKGGGIDEASSFECQASF